MSSNNSSTTPEIVQGESLEASIPPTVLPSISSGYKEIRPKDGKEIVAAAADFIPGLGKLVNYALQSGEYSPEERLKAVQYDWLVQEIHKISAKLDQLINELPREEHPQAADVAAILKAALKVSQKTGDYKKRKRLKYALTNAFDKEQYKEGLTLRLLSILEKLEYGDLFFLKEMYRVEHNSRSVIKQTSKLAKYLYQDHCHINYRLFSKESLEHHHIEVLIQNKLVYLNERYVMNIELSDITVTELGERILKFTYKKPAEKEED